MLFCFSFTFSFFFFFFFKHNLKRWRFIKEKNDIKQTPWKSFPPIRVWRMASQNLVFLIDSAYGSQSAGAAAPNLVRLGSLKLLNYFGCKYGFEKVRWGFKFFDSLQAKSKLSRASDFRELKEKHLEEFERELGRRCQQAGEKRLQDVGSLPCRAVVIQNALKETLLDYQWDRPDITSPTKATLRTSRRRPVLHGIGEASSSLMEDDLASRNQNVLFLFHPCPHSRSELERFGSVGSPGFDDGELFCSQQLLEKLLPPKVQDLLLQQKIVLHWVDTAEYAKLLELPNHFGYRTVREVLQQVGGSMVPLDGLLQLTYDARGNPARLDVEYGAGEPALSHFNGGSCTVMFPFESSINYLMCSEPLYRVAFPQLTAVLSIAEGLVTEEQHRCAVTLDPVSCTPRTLLRPRNITLKGTVRDWDPLKASPLGTSSWILQRSKETLEPEAETPLFQQLLKRLTCEGLHMVADVTSWEGLPTVTGVLSPLTATVALLTLIWSEPVAGVVDFLSQGTMAESTEEIESSELPEVVSGVLNHLYSSKEEEHETHAEDDPVPPWVQQELSRETSQGTALVEGWFPFSSVSGSSSALMESFRLLQAGEEEEEESDPEAVLTNCLSEFYQRKADQDFGAAAKQGNGRRRGLQRTPVRQKMKTMSRSLQMLNVARLNVKAQKLQPEGPQQPLVGEKGPRKPSKRRSGDERGEKGRLSACSVDFKTEEELVSHLKESYQKAVSEGDSSERTLVHSTVATIKSFFKTGETQDTEMNCINLLKTHLLKTSKAIRQQYENSQQKEAKVRECRLQCLLRLEVCAQCPSLQGDECTEQLVEEMIEMLRILSLTKDPPYLTRFLEEEVLVIYVPSIATVLGDLYYSLGTQVPEKLALVLPAHFFSDESMSQENNSVSEAQLPPSVAASADSTGNKVDQLEELRTRSAKKRRHSSLARHRSITESSQGLRQIEMPARSLRRENSQSHLSGANGQLLPPQKETVQEVIKVRRNLFNQEALSPRKRLKMLRSQSVSAVEGLKHRRSRSTEGARDHRKLLTTKVMETPLHKQVSNRLLHRQIKGRQSDSALDVGIVEESPEKPAETKVRRSPRINKQSFACRGSSSFYSLGQPKSRNLERVHSASLLQSLSTQKAALQSPKRLLFGAVLEKTSPEAVDAPERRKSRQHLSSSEELNAVQTLRKSSRKTPQKFTNPSAKLRTPRKSHSRFPRTTRRTKEDSGKSPRKTTQRFTSPSAKFRTPKKSPLVLPPLRSPSRTPGSSRKKTPSKSPALTKRVAKDLGKSFTPSKDRRNSPSKFPKRKSECSLAVTPQKDSSPGSKFSSPLKHMKNFCSPEKTPQKSTPDMCKNSSQMPQRAPGSSSARSPVRIRVRTRSTPGKSETELQETWFAPTLHTPTGTPLKPVTPCTPKSPRRTSQMDTLIVHVQKTSSLKHSPCKTVPDTSCTPEGTPQKSRFPSPRTPRDSTLPSSQTPSRTNCNIFGESEIHYPERPVKPRSASLKDTLKAKSNAPTANFSSNKTSTQSPLWRPSTDLSSPSQFLKQQSPVKALSEPEWTIRAAGVRSSRKGSKSSENQQTISSPSQKALKFQKCNTFNTSLLVGSRDVKNVLVVQTHVPNSQNSSQTLEDVPGSQVSAGVVLVSERLDSSSLASTGTSESFTISSQTEEESVEVAGARVVPMEAELKMKPSFSRKQSSSIVWSTLPSTPSTSAKPKDSTSPSTYEFRWTPDRRQRLAAARLEAPMFPTKSSIPRAPQASKSRGKVALEDTPTYEVELEMQDSGLPKLRFKRTDSSSKLGLENDLSCGQHQTPKGHQKNKDRRSPLPDLSGAWCARHSGKAETGCISPSCFHSSHGTPAKSTPGKGGVQTYICQSCTPTRSTPSTASPSQAEGGIPWTPSPQHRGRATPDAIKNWPRKKKAATGTSGNSRNKKGHQECAAGNVPVAEKDSLMMSFSEPCSSKALNLEDIELEGVCRLQEQSPSREEVTPEDASSRETFGLRSRKRGSGCLSPGDGTLRRVKKPHLSDTDGLGSCFSEEVGSLDKNKLEQTGLSTLASRSRSFARQISTGDDEVFNISAVTPPSGKMKVLSANSLFALTQSPLLYQGKTPPSREKRTAGDGSDLDTPTSKRSALAATSDPETVPFTQVSARRSTSRTYSRKKLL
nr:PREDICTED: treslin isoform X2 [Latimeria chalumnae]|eukprot:XP_005989828.1 PREDICTED: treslin isoform X2 [Latimeria chalumnae]